MGWGDTYAKIVDALKKRNGAYDSTTPKMKTGDMVAMLGMYTGAIVNSIERVADAIVRSDFASVEGELVPLPHGVLNILANAMDTIDARTYVSKTSGLTGAIWKRTPAQLTDVQQERAQAAGISIVTYEPVRAPSSVRNTQLEQIGFLRQTMADYDRALNTSAAALQSYELGFVNSDRAKSFLSSMRALGSDLDVLTENPPTTLSQDLSGALDSAVAKSEAALASTAHAAGKAAAEIGNVAGDVAGSFTSGFLEKAGVLTLVVAGIAMYIALN